MIHCWTSTWIPISLALYGTLAADTDYNVLNTDGSYDFRYDNPDSFHESHANRNNIVNGAFGGRNPATGNVDKTEYTAGPRGFRPKGKNVVRKYDLSQRPVGPIGNKDDPYFDPYEDPSYNFQFNTRGYNRKEGANRFGDVKGSYSYLDDVGDKHEVEYIAGKNTGFHVKTPYPDSYPNAYRTLFFRDPRKPYMRGRSFVQRGIDGSYRFAALAPDHRRTEVSDSVGNVRGSYTYKDEKGVLHSVHYIAGPNIGYRVLKNVKGPHLPTIFPFNSQDIVPSDFYEGKEDSDVFAQAASTYITPKPGKDESKFPSEDSNQINKGIGRPGRPGSPGRPERPGRPEVIPTKPPQAAFGGGGSEERGDEEEEGLFDDLFNSGVKPAPGSRPRPRPSTVKPSTYRPPIAGRPRPRPTTSKPVFGTEVSRPGTAGFEGNRPDLGVSQENRPNVGASQESRPDFGASQGITPDFGTTVGISQSGKPSSDGSQENESSFAGSQGNKPGYRPSSDNNIFGTKPASSTGDIFSTKPSQSDDNLFDLGSNEDIFRPTSSTQYGSRPSSSEDLFSQRPRPRPPQPGKPLLQFDLTGPENGDPYHTIITNYGDTVFTAPPGVPVRAHVQSIGLIPLYLRSPSPNEQYIAEIESGERDEDVQTTGNRHVRVSSTSSTVTATTLPMPSTTATTAQTLETTTSSDATTTWLVESTTTS